MKTISIGNLKGGVSKTISAVNISDVLTRCGYKVLLVDCDKQGNSSMFFDVFSETEPSIADVLTTRNYPIETAIKGTKWDIDVLPANFSLEYANKQILFDTRWAQQYRLRGALEHVADRYDYCVIDCAPGTTDMPVINALSASDDILIPVKVDRFTFSGMKVFLECVEDIKEFNPKLRVAGAFYTMWEATKINAYADELKKAGDFNIPFFETRIRKATAVNISTLTGTPLNAASKPPKVAQDYACLVAEYCANN